MKAKTILNEDPTPVQTDPPLRQGRSLLRQGSQNQPISPRAAVYGLTGALAEAFDRGYEQGLLAEPPTHRTPVEPKERPKTRTAARELGYHVGRMSKGPTYGIGYMQGRGAS